MLFVLGITDKFIDICEDKVKIYEFMSNKTNGKRE